MTKQFIKDTFLLGFLLWIIGYLLGIMLFSIVPHALIGWMIMPLGISLTTWILVKKVNADYFQYYLSLAIVWTLIAIILDYFLLVNLFKPHDGYYKTDVYIYYALTFILPILVGWKKSYKVK